MITIRKADITTENVEAIVNAANAQLKGGGGVDGAIHNAAGPSVMEACRKIGGCETGNAVVTEGGNLKAKYIVHAVGPVWRGGGSGEAEQLEGAYRNSFEEAKKAGAKTIALPAISTGVYGYPKEPAARVALAVGKGYERDFDEIRFVCFSDEDLEIYEQVWKQVSVV